MAASKETYRDVEPLEDAVEDGPAGRQIVCVIGVDHYDHWARLHNAVNDARGARDLFLQLGFTELCPPLLDGAATGDAIRRLVKDDLAQLEPVDSLVLFFAGHGHTQTRTIAGGTVCTGYLIPADGAPNAKLTSSWVDLDSWMHNVAQLPAKHILVILDACHAGIALGTIMRVRGAAAPADPLATLRARRSRRVITSALDNEVALDGGPVPGHSLFTGCLIEALTSGLGVSGQRQVTGSELGLHLQRCVKTYPRSRQTPDFGTFELDDRGELVVPILQPPPVRTPDPPPPPRPEPERPPPAGIPRLAVAIGAGVAALIAVVTYVVWPDSPAHTAAVIDGDIDGPAVAPTLTPPVPVPGAVLVRGAQEPRPLLGLATTRSSSAFKPSANVSAPATDYWISSTEVTWRQLMAAMPRLQRVRDLTAGDPMHGPWLRGGKQELRARRDTDGDDLPVGGISWSLALAYCAHVGGDLPSEEEWEWAARGETVEPPPVPLFRYARDGMEWKRSTGVVAVGTTASDVVQVSGGVVHDLLGNLEEWTRDEWRTPSTGQPAPFGRATRGFPPTTDTGMPEVEDGATYRGSLDPDAPKPYPRHKQVGFRCVWPAT